MTKYFKLNDKKESWLLINDDKIRMLHGYKHIIIAHTVTSEKNCQLSFKFRDDDFTGDSLSSAPRILKES